MYLSDFNLNTKDLLIFLAFIPNMGNNKEQTSKSEGWNVFLPKERKEIKLDKRDQIIIQALTENSRTTLATLSKITQLSKGSIINRMNNYKTHGLITGYSTFINIHKLGFKMITVYIKTKMTLIQKEEYINYLKGIEFLNQIVTFSSARWDFMVRIYAKDNKHLDELITHITNFPEIVNINIAVMDEWFYEPINYFDIDIKLSEKCKKEDSSFQKTFSKKRISKLAFDKKDLEILNILSHDARISLIKLGEKIDLSSDAIKYRIKNLINAGIIECFFANINPFLLGYTSYVINLQIFDRTKIYEIINYLKKHTKCSGVAKFLESWNVFAAILFKESREIKIFEEEFLKRFRKAVNNYEIVQISEQPYYKLFLKEFKTIIKD